MSTAATRPRRTRAVPFVIAALSLLAGGLLTGGLLVVGLDRTGGSAPPASGAFVAFRGRHRVGDTVGPNAKVAAVDRFGQPTALISTDGKAPVAWAFEQLDPTILRPVKGQPVDRFDASSLWVHPACPSPICAATPAAPLLRTPPPALDVDVCRSLSATDLSSLLGVGPITTSAPTTGTCVWVGRSGGVQIEVGGPAWWPYLTARTDLYHPLGPGGDALVDFADGLHIAARNGPLTAVLLTSTNTAAPGWAQIARKVAAWATSG